MSPEHDASSFRGRTTHVRVSHCADFSWRYPGETVTLYTKVEVYSALTSYTLRVGLPSGLNLGAYRAYARVPGSAPNTRPEYRTHQALPTTTWSGRDGEGVAVNWSEEGNLQPGDCYQYVVEAEVSPTQQDLVVESRAALTARTARGGTVRDEETVVTGIEAKSRALKYLPAIYREDELMGRFLMLFESFWEPIQSQIVALPDYFDPSLTPSDFLPWLATWIDLTLDEQWPEERRRQLLRSAVPLFRRRGTCRGLAEYLEIYSDATPDIVEYRAQNFRLGPGGQLGSGIALGTDNVPHTFAVRLRLPPVKGQGLDVRVDGPPHLDRKDEAERLELMRRRKIEAIIESQKPAHTRYKLFLEIEPGLAG